MSLRVECVVLQRPGHGPKRLETGVDDPTEFLHGREAASEDPMEAVLGQDALRLFGETSDQFEMRHRAAGSLCLCLEHFVTPFLAELREGSTPGDVDDTLAHTCRDGFRVVPTVKRLLDGRRLFQRMEVLPLEILGDGHGQVRDIVERTDDGRDMREAGELGGSPATLPGTDLPPFFFVWLGPDQDGLEHAVAGQGLGQRLHGGLGDGPTLVVRRGDQTIDGNHADTMGNPRTLLEHLHETTPC